MFLFAGSDRLYSPILHGVVELLPGDSSKTISLTPEMFTRITVYEGKNRARPVRSMMEKTFTLAVKHQLKWVSDNVMTVAQIFDVARQGIRRSWTIKTEPWGLYA